MSDKQRQTAWKHAAVRKIVNDQKKRHREQQEQNQQSSHTPESAATDELGYYGTAPLVFAVDCIHWSNDIKRGNREHVEDSGIPADGELSVGNPALARARADTGDVSAGDSYPSISASNAGDTVQQSDTVMLQHRRLQDRASTLPREQLLDHSITGVGSDQIQSSDFGDHSVSYQGNSRARRATQIWQAMASVPEDLPYKADSPVQQPIEAFRQHHTHASAAASSPEYSQAKTSRQDPHSTERRGTEERTRHVSSGTGKAKSETKQEKLRKQMTTQGKKKAQRDAAKAASFRLPRLLPGSASNPQGTAAAVNDAAKAIKTTATALKLPGILLIAPLLIVVFFIGFLLVALLGSAFGIFLSGDSGIKDAIHEINQEYIQELQEIRDDVPHDELDITGAQADWRTVLSVYAVKTANSTEDAMEVVTMDDVKKDLLRQIFWDMNSISWETEIYEIPDPNAGEAETEDTEEPSSPRPSTEETEPPFSFIPYTITPLTEEVPMIEQIRLQIDVSHRSASEMATLYQFTEEQKSLLNDLLSPDNLALWNDIIYGITSEINGDIVAVAASQIGNYNGNPYWSWYGFGSRVEWCACFVSWCANECGYISAGIIPRYAGVGTGVQWFKGRNQWQGPDYIPQPGDIIFFDYAGNETNNDHTGIVEKVDGRYIYTIEGNASNAVKRCRYPFGFSSIKGYGIPAYEDLYGSTKTTDPIEQQTTDSGNIIAG